MSMSQKTQLHTFIDIYENQGTDNYMKQDDADLVNTTTPFTKTVIYTYIKHNVLAA